MLRILSAIKIQRVDTKRTETELNLKSVQNVSTSSRRVMTYSYNNMTGGVKKPERLNGRVNTRAYQKQRNSGKY